MVQQGLTTAGRLREVLECQGRIRYRRFMLGVLEDLGGGAQAMSEIDIVRLCHRNGLPEPRLQTVRADSQGKRRYIDLEFELADGSVRLVEVDGIGHLDPDQWYADLFREADLTVDDHIPLLRLPARAALVDEVRVVDLLRRFLTPRRAA